MGFNDPGGWGSRTPRDRTLDKLVYDEAHKKGGGGNTGCAIWLILACGLIVLAVLGRAC
ncbi:MAG: hypothetical protein ACOX8O_00565 [Christensenellales bacterium]|jgi:hypothetical protein